MRRCLLTFIISGVSFLTLLGQISISGRILDERTAQPLKGVLISTESGNRAVSDEHGRFSIEHAETQDIVLILEFGNDITSFKTTLEVVRSSDIGDIAMRPSFKIAGDLELPTITIVDDENAESASISGLLQSGGDLFSRITSYTFSPARYNRRGLEAEYSEGYLNYFSVNDLESGGVYWSNWGGLNDVMREDDEVIGAELSDWGFGGVGSSFNTDLRASTQRQRTRISYAVANRNYRNRLMGTWSTGLRPSGWAFTLSASRRWAREGYIPGTFYDGWSYYGSAEKKLSDRHSLGFVVLASRYQRGGNSTSTQEMYDLAGDHYYNSFWGYQQGEKRNSRVYSGHQPYFLLRHDWTVNEKVSITSSLGYQTGQSVSQALDWLNANDPRPDYYRRLPSYVDNELVAEQIRQTLTSNKDLLQIQWDNLYQVNLNSHFTVQNVNGVEGQTHTGALSQYILEDRISGIDKKAANVVLQYLVSQNSKLLVGGNATIQHTRNYKEVADLLGGEFYVDWDKYAEQDFPGDENALQNDLRRPNRIVFEGDQVGYDYESRISQYGGWVSYALDSRKWELGIAGAVESRNFYRQGFTQNGKFPDNSYGEGARHDFFLPSGKGLIRYKIDGRNYITLSGMMSERAPTFRNAYVSPRTRDQVVSGLTKEKVKLGEIRYDLKSPYLKLTLAGFYITSADGIESSNFYHDDERTFVNFSLTGIDKQYKGVEAAVEYTVFPGFTVQGAAAIGEYIYTSRPLATITQDNDGDVLQENITVYAKNLYVSGTPQEAYTVGLTYRSKQYWTLYLNVSRFAEHWINFNPIRRTGAGVDLVEYGSDQWKSILQQEKTDPGYTVDLSFYKSWLVNWPEDRATFAINIGVSNILDNQDYINNGYEQYRYDFAEKDIHTFPSRYSYMQGLNYFIQASLQF
jgi:hypothetical protein